MVINAAVDTPQKPSVMRAGIQLGVRQYGLTEIPRPVAGPGSVVARVCLAGVCGSDLHRYYHRPEPQTVPDGHEVVAVVEEVGEGVTRVKPGDRVVIDLITLGRGCGQCMYCRSGNHTHCQDPARPRLSGAFSEYVVAKEAGFFKIPSSLDDRAAVLIEPVAVGFHAVRWSRMDRDSTAVVLGAGTIGLATLLAAKASGAGRVFITAKHPFQADMARRLGATEVLQVDPELAHAAVKEATGGLGADIVFETVGGAAPTIDLACRMVRPQAKVVVLGLFFDGPVSVDFFHPLLKETTIYLPDCYSTVDRLHDFEPALELVDSQSDTVLQLVTHEFSLDEVGQAFATAADKSTGSIKVLVRP